MKPLCPNCFLELSDPVYCRYCGYQLSEKTDVNAVLKPMTVLQERYIIGRTLGVGGFGITYLAYDLSSKQKVAIKEYMPSELAVTDEAGNVMAKGVENEHVFEHCKEGFINEARILYQLRNDKTIVKVKDYFEEKQTAFLVMEYLEGCTMKEKMRRSNGKITVAEATVMLLSVGSALMSVHEKGVLHRDISPENIFFTKSGEYKLIDFGASRYYVSRQNKSLSVLLKPGFAPPEQYSSRGNQGPWTDVYSLAATYYFLVSGVKLIDTMDRLAGVEMSPLNTVCPEVPEKTSKAIEKAMALNYKNRYQTVLEFLNDVDYHCKIDSMLTTELPRRGDTIAEISLEKSVSGQTGSDQSVLVKDVPIMQCEIHGKILSSVRFTKVNSQIKIGRGSNAGLIIPDNINISRIHCIAEYDFKIHNFTIIDTSTNGTFFSDSKTRLQENKAYIIPADTSVYLADPAVQLKFLYMDERSE